MLGAGSDTGSRVNRLLRACPLAQDMQGYLQGSTDCDEASSSGVVRAQNGRPVGRHCGSGCPVAVYTLMQRSACPLPTHGGLCRHLLSHLLSSSAQYACVTFCVALAG